MRALFVVFAAGLMMLPMMAATDFVEGPVRPFELGMLPTEGATCKVNPPPFIWRPQGRATHSYRLEYWRDGHSKEKTIVTGIVHNVHCPDRTFIPGSWRWRVAREFPNGKITNWSATRKFSVAKDAVIFPRPSDGELFARIPVDHPRLFLTPRILAEYRATSNTVYNYGMRLLAGRRPGLLSRKRDFSEPGLYGVGESRSSAAWKKRWGGNYAKVVRLMSDAAELAFNWRLTGDVACGEEARRILMEVAKWDPRGATGYRYNDEAGMPIMSFGARAYTFLADFLTPAERSEFCAMIRVRGDEMYNHLCPSMLYAPYRSHGNRAWHFLAEGGVAFFGEIPEAEKWLSFAFDYLWCVHPVWGDEDGGWHEGVAYWQSYMGRFVDWAAGVEPVFDVDFLSKPYFSRAGDFLLYQAVPGFHGVGFADCAEEITTISRFASTMPTFAYHSGNPYWLWFAEKALGPRHDAPPSYVVFQQTRERARHHGATLVAKAPTDMKTSMCFRGSGIACLNTCLDNATNDVQVLFKSSPRLGLFSHGYDANNSFLLNAYGERLFVHGGYRDCFGSAFHTNYMWHTRSCNCITADGDTQQRHLITTRGEITRFSTSPLEDMVEGRVGDVWEKGIVTNFVRMIRFRKTEPVTIEIRDRLSAKEPVCYTWHLHTPSAPFSIAGQHDVMAVNGRAVAKVDFVEPAGLILEQTDVFDPPIGCGLKLVQHHLSATVPTAVQNVEFVTVIRPSRNDETDRVNGELKNEKKGLH